MAAEDCDAALSISRRAIELDPDFGLAYDGLGAAHVNRVFKGFGGAEDFEKAEAAFNKALAIDPNIIEARMLMVFVLSGAARKQKAREEVARMRRQAPDEAVVYFVKATLHRLDGEYDRALRAYDQLVRLDPASFVVVSYNRALIFLYEGKFEEAQTRTRPRRFSRTQQSSAEHGSRAGVVLHQTACEAEQILREVLQANPNLHGVRPTLAMCLSRQGKHEAAWLS